ncbi:MAG: TolC family protein [Deltaproteobacteria bacterium]|nr:TolC family protein [Deltaproteobacteria bacterium]MDZ4346631.1 TolC family protein [Candidatus Binatia bacterium]
MTNWCKATPRQIGFWLGVLMLFYPRGGQSADAPAPAIQMTRQATVPNAGQILTLDDALLIALDNHPNLQAARERIGAQRAVLGQQMAAYYPTITLNNTYRSTLQTGTTSTSGTAIDFFSSQANASWILYNFGKREGAVQAARETLNATGHNYKTIVDGVIVGVKQSYYTYLQARAIVVVREETIKSRDLLVRQARGFYEVGTKARIDVVRAESNLYTAQADLIAAQNAVKVAWVTLKNAMGLRELPERPLVEEVIMTTIPYSLDEAREIAYVTRPELKSFEAQRKAQDQNIATARRGHLPDITFDGSYGRRNTSGGGDTFPLALSWQAQLSLNIPIFDGFRTTNRVEETLRNYYVIKSQEEQQRQQVALEVEQSYLRLVELQERIKANEAAAKAAKENLDLANGRYQVGVGSIIEVTDAQTLYTESQTTYVRALYDYKIADAQFVRAIGK